MNDASPAAICETLRRARTEAIFSNRQRGRKNIRLPVPPAFRSSSGALRSAANFGNGALDDGTGSMARLWIRCTTWQFHRIVNKPTVFSTVSCVLDFLPQAGGARVPGGVS